MTTKLLNIYLSGTKAHDMAAQVVNKGLIITANKFLDAQKKLSFVSVNQLGKAPGIRSISGADAAWKKDTSYVFLDLAVEGSTLYQRVCGSQRDVIAYLNSVVTPEVSAFYQSRFITLDNHLTTMAQAFQFYKGQYCQMKGTGVKVTETAEQQNARVLKVLKALDGDAAIATAKVKYIDKPHKPTLPGAKPKGAKKGKAVTTPGTPRGKRVKAATSLAMLYDKLRLHNAGVAAHNSAQASTATHKPWAVLNMTAFPNLEEIKPVAVAATSASRQRGNPSYEFIVMSPVLKDTGFTKEQANQWVRNKYAEAFRELEKVNSYAVFHPAGSQQQALNDLEIQLSEIPVAWKQAASSPRRAVPAIIAGAAQVASPTGYPAWYNPNANTNFTPVPVPTVSPSVAAAARAAPLATVAPRSPGVLSPPMAPIVASPVARAGSRSFMPTPAPSVNRPF